MSIINGCRIHFKCGPAVNNISQGLINARQGVAQNFKGSGAIGEAIGQSQSSNADLWQQTADYLSGKSSKGPAAPDGGGASNPALSAQQQYAQKFQKELPQMQAKMAQQLTQQSNQQMQGQLKGVNQNNFSRGLGYGGVNAGQQAGVRAGAQQQLAGQISGANASLENASNTLNAQAVETGVGIQQTQQSIQNDIYKQQLAQQQASNAAAGGLLGMVGSALL